MVVDVLDLEPLNPTPKHRPPAPTPTQSSKATERRDYNRQTSTQRIRRGRCRNQSPASLRSRFSETPDRIGAASTGTGAPSLRQDNTPGSTRLTGGAAAQA